MPGTVSVHVLVCLVARVSLMYVQFASLCMFSFCCSGDGQRNQLLKLTKSALSVLTLLLQAKGEVG